MRPSVPGESRPGPRCGRPFVFGLGFAGVDACPARRGRTVLTEVCSVERLGLGFVVEVNEARCDGCRQCLHTCHFGALLWVSSDKTILVDPWACNGCGTCTTICLRDALTLRLRSER